MILTEETPLSPKTSNDPATAQTQRVEAASSSRYVSFRDIEGVEDAPPPYNVLSYSRQARRRFLTSLAWAVVSLVLLSIVAPSTSWLFGKTQRDPFERIRDPRIPLDSDPATSCVHGLHLLRTDAPNESFKSKAYSFFWNASAPHTFLEVLDKRLYGRVLVRVGTQEDDIRVELSAIADKPEHLEKVMFCNTRKLDSQRLVVTLEPDDGHSEIDSIRLPILVYLPFNVLQFGSFHIYAGVASRSIMVPPTVSFKSIDSNSGVGVFLAGGIIGQEYIPGTINATSIRVINGVGDVAGDFLVEESLSLNTSSGSLNATIRARPKKFSTTAISLGTSSGEVLGTFSLAKGKTFDTSNVTVNAWTIWGPLSLTIPLLPPNISLNAYAWSEGSSATLTLPSTYEGRFNVDAGLNTPILKFNGDEDDDIFNQRRHMEWRKLRSTITGSVMRNASAIPRSNVYLRSRISPATLILGSD